MFAKILRWLTISVGCIGLFLFITPNGFVKLLAIEDTQVYKRNASEDRYKTYTESTMWNVSNEKQQSPNNVLVGVSTSTLNNFIYQEEFTSTTFKASPVKANGILWMVNCALNCEMILIKSHLL